MDIEDVKVIRSIYTELRARIPSDCAEILDKHFSNIIKDIKTFGIEGALKRWNVGEDEVEHIIED